MYIEKLGRNNRQIHSRLLQFAAEYYGFDYLKLRMSARLANQLNGYRSFVIKAKKLNGEKVSTLIWFSDFEFGTLLDEFSSNSTYVEFMHDSMAEISPELAENYLQDYEGWINYTPTDINVAFDESEGM